MVFRIYSAVALIWLILILTIPQNVYAIGSGAYSIGIGDSESVGKGNAFTGEADNPSAVYFNPAGLTQLKGQQASVGFSVIDIRVTHEQPSGNKSQLQRHPVLVPHLYYTNNIKENVTVGLGGNGTWGSGFEWNPDDTTRRYNVTQSEILPLDNYISMGYAVNDQLSLGIGTSRHQVNVDLEKKIAQASPPTGDADFQLKGDDASWGYNLSALYKVNERHQFGIKYQSKVKLNLEGTATLTGLNDLGSTPFATIFGAASYTTEAKTKLTEPQSVTLGYSFMPNEKWKLNADVEWMDWSSSEDLIVEYPNESGTKLTILNTGNRSLDWRSVFSFAAGGEYLANDRLTLRGGYFFRPTPIPEINFDAFLPDADSHGLTLGFGYDFTKDLILDMSYAARFMEKRKIDNAVGNSVGGNVDGTYTEFMNIVTATMTYKF